MIIEKNNKHWQTSTTAPNKNFSEHDDSEVWVVEDGSELADKIIALKTHWDAVLDDEGNLIDVTDNDPTYNQRKQAEETRIARIAELKKNLADTDYIACKIAEGAATTAEYADQIAERQEWREEINSLESTNV